MTQFLLTLTCLLAVDTLTGKVVKVTDGDTITVLVNNEQIKIRLSEIDAPEHGQDYGEKSKDALADLVFGKEVRVVTHGKDRYGRTIGDVFVGQTNVNEKLVEDGWAWNFLKYSKSQRLAELEKEAKEAKRGLWAGKAPTAPWDYRAEQARKRIEGKAKSN
jgi:endonuclease YncB( thermonuclease family)